MTNKTINLALGIHNHQPYGNFDNVIEHACERCYLPFLQVLEHHPTVKCSVHFTGYLLAWVADRYPEIIKAMERLVAREQIELVTGGYYEPIFATIPDTDKVGQIKRLTDYIHKLFGRDGVDPEVTGMWLAERVWEPHLPRALASAGVKYVCLDDSHFKGVGMEEGSLYRTFMTEEQGHTLEIFPINEKLRYVIPFEQPEKIIEYLRSIATEGGERGAFYFDDGEKFGVWPGTYDSVYTQRWLHRFFEAIEANSDWIKSRTFGEYRRQVAPAGRVYLPTASYMEMLEWSLPAERANLLEEARKKVDPRYASFLRGGFWRYFMVKYPEVNNLHKKMLRACRQLEEMTQAGSCPPQAADAVRDKLWSAQSNDPYWHGVFGGLYLTNLRTANYQALVEAEAKLDHLKHIADGAHWVEYAKEDIDCDGQEEVSVKTPVCNYYIAPAYGGALIELDYKPRPFNLIDTLARRPESYHTKLRDAGSAKDSASDSDRSDETLTTKEKNLDKYLVYDWHRRLCFLDHFLDPSTTIEGMSRMQYGEKGDFVNQPYALESVTSDNGQVKLSLSRNGNVWVGDLHAPLKIEKVYTLSGASETARVSYTIANTGSRQIATWFAPELNFNFLAEDAHDRYYFDPATGKRFATPKLSSQIELTDVTGAGIADEWLGVRLILSWSSPSGLWCYPIYTVSNSEAGFERVYQGSCLVPHWQIILEPGESSQVEFEVSIRGL